MTDTFFTIGHAGRTIDDLIALLDQHKIAVLSLLLTFIV
jgi:hypothetical protein